MNCKKIHINLGEYLHNKLIANKRSAFEDHLKRCDKCAEEVQFYQKMKALKEKKISSIPQHLYTDIATKVMHKITAAENKKKVIGEVGKWRLADEKEFIKKLYGKFIRQVCPILTKQLNEIFDSFYLSIQENKNLSGAYPGPLNKNEMASLLRTGKVPIKEGEHKRLSRYTAAILENIRKVIANSDLPANQKLLAEKHLNHIVKRKAKRKT